MFAKRFFFAVTSAKKQLTAERQEQNICRITKHGKGKIINSASQLQ